MSWGRQHDDDEDDDDDDDDEEEDGLDVSGQDWRDFRARLVMGENKPTASSSGSSTAATTASSSTTASPEIAATTEEEEAPMGAGASSTAEAATPTEDDKDTAVATTGGGDNNDDTVVVSDLDGIGSLFANDTSTTSSSSSSSSLQEELDSMSLLGKRLDDDSSSSSSWAYDSGNVIEQGAVILGGVQQDFGFGLRQQYFHKSAILVLEHVDVAMTKGIILNRPTDLVLLDDVNVGVEWPIWFGGDVQGLNSERPELVCLHSLSSKKKNKDDIHKLVSEASTAVMKDIQWTTFENAKRLVAAGVAHPSDFWVFCGYAGWSPGQLAGELERNSWYMVATDSQTLLQEMAKLSSGGAGNDKKYNPSADPRNAGLDTWTLLMQMIGRGDIAQKSSGGFDDLMLKEYALKYMVSTGAGGGAGDRVRSGIAGLTASSQQKQRQRSSSSPSAAAAASVAGAKPLEPPAPLVRPGSLLRALPCERSPFLLNGQEFHKSVILLLVQDDGGGGGGSSMSIGAILNRPTARGIDFSLRPKTSSSVPTRSVTQPIRYGGAYALKGDTDGDAIMWLHNSPALKAAQIGRPVGRDGAGSSGNDDSDSDDDGDPSLSSSAGSTTIWKCTLEDVQDAVGRGLASMEEFLVVQGVSIWIHRPPTMLEMHGGGPGMVNVFRGAFGAAGLEEKFEPVPAERTAAVWDELTRQRDLLTPENLDDAIIESNRAWSAAAAVGGDDNGRAGEEENNSNGRSGNDDGHQPQHDDPSLVFKSDVKVSKLSDDALRSWIETFLLGIMARQ